VRNRQESAPEAVENRAVLRDTVPEEDPCSGLKDLLSIAQRWLPREEIARLLRGVRPSGMHGDTLLRCSEFIADRASCESPTFHAIDPQLGKTIQNN
jgi:hypothetical protein